MDSGFANEPLQQLVLREILITADTATHPVREWVRIMALDKDLRLWKPRYWRSPLNLGSLAVVGVVLIYTKQHRKHYHK